MALTKIKGTVIADGTITAAKVAAAAINYDKISDEYATVCIFSTTNGECTIGRVSLTSTNPTPTTHSFVLSFLRPGNTALVNLDFSKKFILPTAAASNYSFIFITGGREGDVATIEFGAGVTEPTFQEGMPSASTGDFDDINIGNTGSDYKIVNGTFDSSNGGCLLTVEVGPYVPTTGLRNYYLSFNNIPV